MALDDAPQVRIGLEGLVSEPPAKLIHGPSGRLYGSFAFLCLRPATPPRRWAIQLVESRLFEPIIIATILLNCATMAWESPLDPSGTWKAAVIAQLEPIYLAIYTGEMLVKMLAYGE